MAAALNDSEVFDLLKNLEQRVAKLESKFENSPAETITTISEPVMHNEQESDANDEENEEKLELRIGQFWLAKIGIIALTAGITFLLVIPFEGLTGLLPTIIGLAIAIFLIGLSIYWRQSQTYISEYLLVAGIVISFISLLRLHFFSDKVIIESYFTEVFLLLVVVALTFTASIKRQSFSLALLGITLTSATAFVSDSAVIIFPLLILLSALSVYLKVKFNWQGLLIAGITASYLTHLLWYLNNPFLGNELLIREGSEYSLLFALIYAFIFSMGNIISPKESKEDFFIGFISLINCILFSGVSVFILVTSTNNVLYYFLSSALLIAISIIYWVKVKSKLSTFFYSMFGYMLLSAAVIFWISNPDFYIWLGWQSLIVISTAVWFRSKFIVVTNFAIFISILIAYLASQSNIGLVTISFGIIALVSARILNWQKTRLELTTEQMRNAYLLVALLVIPYSLYQAIPSVYVSFAWIGVAFMYYVLSLILKIKKYRWMALLTLLLTVGYIFILGFTSGNNTYKILSFLTVGVVLIVTSILYSKKKQKIKSV